VNNLQVLASCNFVLIAVIGNYSAVQSEAMNFTLLGWRGDNNTF